MLAIRLPRDIEERLNALAEKTGRTKTYYAREAILEYLDTLEDIYLAEDERYEDIQTGKSMPMPLEEAMKNYGMED